MRIGGVLVQFVEIPGLIEGAHEDRGGGRALLGVLRGADAIVYCLDASSSPVDLAIVRAEVAAAGIELPSLLALTKMDEARPDAMGHARSAFPDLELMPVSIIDDESLEAFKEASWRLTGLVRVFLRRGTVTDEEPLALAPRSTVLDVAACIHKDLVAGFEGARIWGPSSRFDGQRVGREQVVADGDSVEVLA